MLQQTNPSSQEHYITFTCRWWDNQAESDLKRVANVALAFPVTQASVNFFSGLRYILIELKLGLKENKIEAIMFQRCNT